MTSAAASTAAPWLQGLMQADRETMASAADAVLNSLQAFAAAGENPVTAVLRNAGPVTEWAHYPAGDVTDPQSGALYYYHAHAAAERRDGEHGHFHTFMQSAAAAGNDATGPETPARLPVVHLIGVATDARGQPRRLFTTNRWVTGEQWHDAAATMALLARFAVTTDRPSAALNAWVTGLLRLFRPQIVDLIRARDARIAAHRHRHPDRDVFEDRTLQVTSECAVDLVAQIEAVERSCGARR